MFNHPIFHLTYHAGMFWTAGRHIVYGQEVKSVLCSEILSIVWTALTRNGGVPTKCPRLSHFFRRNCRSLRKNLRELRTRLIRSEPNLNVNSKPI